MSLPNLDFNNSKTLQNAKKILDLLATYHQHKVENLDCIPTNGPALILTNHSLATYDGFLLGKVIIERFGRVVRGLGDDLLFKTPVLRDWCYDIGLVPASPKNALELLERGELVALAPGGMKESLLSTEERNQLHHRVLWNDRKGFVRLAMEAKVPVILAACPQSENIYTVYRSEFTQSFYKKFHFPLPVFKGLGPTLLPRPIELTHQLSGPYQFELDGNEFPEEAVLRWHRFIQEEMGRLMGATQNLDKNSTNQNR